MNLNQVVFLLHLVSMAGSLKKDKVRIRTINGNQYVLNGKKGIRGEICCAIHRYL